MKLTYLDAADSEFDEAIAYYNEERAGLGFHHECFYGTSHRSPGHRFFVPGFVSDPTRMATIAIGDG